MKDKSKTIKTLCFGNAAELYYSFNGFKVPKQLDQIDHWLPEILIFSRANPKHEEPEYIDNEYVELPEFMDIPFFILSGGDYSITMPIQKDDECLIVFADSCIDSWWQSGGIQNPIEIRNHDLSDCFALVGFRSQNKKLDDFDSESFQIRRKDKIPVEISEDTITIKNEDCEIKIDDDEINILKGENVEIKIDSSNNVSIKSNAKITLHGNNGVEISSNNHQAVDFFNHYHHFVGQGVVGVVA